MFQFLFEVKSSQSMCFEQSTFGPVDDFFSKTFSFQVNVNLIRKLNNVKKQNAIA